MLGFLVFYIPFYFITRFRSAFLEIDADETSNQINWAVIVPFIFEMFVISWVFMSLFDNAKEED